MFDEINGTLPEVEATPEVVNQPEESIQEQPPQRKPKDNEQKNFAALRQKAEQAERERDAAIKKLQEIEQQSEEFTLGSDDIAEGKHLKKVHQNVSREIKQLKDELNLYKKQAIESATEARIKSTYQDFDSVVTSDNLSTLRDAHPELAATINSAPDLYSQAVTAYTMIKKLGIAADRQYQGDREKAQTNAYKPRPATSVSPQQGDNPLTRANAFADGLTDELKEQLRKEMYSSIRNNN